MQNAQVEGWEMVITCPECGGQSTLTDGEVSTDTRVCECHRCGEKLLIPTNTTIEPFNWN
jgi:hypothetical protein